MKNNYLLLSMALTLISISTVFSQKTKKVQLDIASFDPAGIPIDKISALLDTTTEVFSRYVTYGSLLDNSGNPNHKYLIKYKRLFATNAKVVNDFLKRPGDLINYVEYINFAESFLDYEGIKYDIKDSKIESISVDDNYYRINVRFKKLMYQGLDKDMYYKKYRKPFPYDITMTITLSKITMETPEIVRIIGHNLVKPIPKRESFAGVFFTYGLASLQGTKSDFLVDNNTDIGNILNGKSHISFGADYMRNITGGKNIYWNIGLRMNIVSFDMKSNDTIAYHQKMNYDNTVEYDRIVRIKPNATNATTITTISIPFGLSYRMDKGSMHTLFVGAGIMPSFIQSISHNFKGSFEREIIIDRYEPLVNEFKNGDQLNCNGPADINTGLVYSPKVKNYSISGLLSLKYLYKYQYNQSFAVIFNYGIDLTPTLPNASEIFLGDNTIPDGSLDTNTSFTQSVYKDVKAKVISFGVGWYYNFKSRGLLY